MGLSPRKILVSASLLLMAQVVWPQEFFTVVDGYDAPSQFENYVSFNTNTMLSNKWQARYLSGVHLRLVAESNSAFSSTVSDMLTQAGDVARIVDVPRSGDSPPWVASYNSRARIVELRRHNYYPRSDDLPHITTRDFDAISNDSFSANNLEWAAALEVQPRLTKIVWYRYDGLWQADTLDTFPTRIRALAIKFSQHPANVKSIATVSDSAFRVQLWRGANWETFVTPFPFQERFFTMPKGTSTEQGAPIWLYGRNLIRFETDTLLTESVPLDSTVLSYTSQDLFIENDGTQHLLYHVRKANGVFSLQYFRHANGAWSTENVMTPAPSRLSAALTVVQDTVLVAVGDLRDQRMLILRKANEGWPAEVVDQAGDVGIELSVAFRPEEYETVIAYYDRTNNDLKLANGTGSYGFDQPLKVQTVDSEGDVGRFPKVALCADSTHIVYFDESMGAVKHALQTPASIYPNQWGPWRITTIDSVGEVNVPPGLTNQAGHPEIAYENTVSDSLKYASFSNGGWLFENIAPVMLAAPGEISLFRTADSLYAGYVENGELRLAVQTAPGLWEVSSPPSAGEPAYAAWAADALDNLNVVYRLRQGFHDEIRHASRTDGVWNDAPIVTTVTPGTYLKFKQSNSYNLTLILAFADDGRARTYCYGGHDWFKVMEGSRFMSDTAIDFTLTDLFTLTLFYRAPGDRLQPYDPSPFPDLVADVVVSIVDVVENAQARIDNPMSFNLFPNPFNEQTTIEYTVGRQGQVRIDVYNLRGQRVLRLLDEMQAAGQYRLTFSGNGLASGVYLCNYSISGEFGTVKMTLIK